MSTDSEFICDVVQITAIEPHPGADQLDLVTISLDGKTPFPSKIVNAKGGLTVGEYAVYVGPDSIVPLTETGPFAFLRERLDAKGKSHYRVRSVRIRGVYSPGLLIRLPCVALLGDSLAGALEVTNYAPTEHSSGITTSVGVQKLRAKDLYPVYSVTSLKKCPYTFTDGDIVCITEKIHGTNFRFGYGGKRRFYYGTHRTNLSDNRGMFTRLWHWLRRRGSWVNNNPYHGNVWADIVTTHNLVKECKDAREYIFYGEIYGSGIQKNFDYNRSRPDFAIFDVYDPNTKMYLTRSQRDSICASLGFPIVPELYVGEYSFDKVKELAEKDSTFGGIREGVVVESLSRPRAVSAQDKAKWVSEKYHLVKEK